MVATWRSGGGGTEDSSFLDDWLDDGSAMARSIADCPGQIEPRRTRKRTGRGEFVVLTTDPAVRPTTETPACRMVAKETKDGAKDCDWSSSSTERSGRRTELRMEACLRSGRRTELRMEVRAMNDDSYQ